MSNTYIDFFDDEFQIASGNPSGVELVESVDVQNSVEIEVEGIQGPKGDTGDTGPTGPAGPQGPSGGSAVIHDQQVASAHWVITHVGGYPSVTVIDTSGTKCEGEITYTTNTQIDILFSSPFSGKALLNY